jgi:beta-N-acetylhexosaminidase
MNTEWINKLLDNMTLEEKVGQLLMVGFYNLNQETLPEIKEKIIKYNLGGFFHFNASQNFLSGVFSSIQEDVRIPILVGADYELGTGWTVKEGVIFPRPMARGYAGNRATEYEIAKNIAIQGRSVGTHITFSPVVDVNTHFLCPDVNIRSYGDDPDKIVDLSAGFIKGLQENGMLATVKHFPGNGGTIMDQHISASIINYNRKEMHDIFLKPYKRAIKENVAAVMIAHLEVPSLCTEIEPRSQRIVPASMSKQIITDLLREELGFKGLVITDATNMGGVNSQFSRFEANVKTIQAGADIILDFYPFDFELDYESILTAVQKGTIPEERLNDAVRNILTAKAKLNLDKDKGMPESKEEREKIFAPGKTENLCQSIAEKSVTLIRNRNGVLPIRDIKGKKVCVLNAFSPENQVLISQGQFPIPEIIVETLKNRGALVDTYDMTSDLNQGKVKEIALNTSNHDYTFLNFFIVPNYAVGTLFPNRNALRLFTNGIITVAKRLIITSFGDPYVMLFCQAAPVYLCTFDESVHSQYAAIKAWFGEIDISGKMPVSFKGFFKRGDGILLKKIKN